MTGQRWCPDCGCNAARRCTCTIECPGGWHRSPADYYPPLVTCRTCATAKLTTQVRPPDDPDVRNRGVCTNCQPPVEALRSLLRFR